MIPKYNIILGRIFGFAIYKFEHFSNSWKSRVRLTPEGEFVLTPENVFILTP